MQSWPVKKAYFWETAPFFRLLVPLIGSIACYQLFNHLNNGQQFLIYSAFLTIFFLLFIISALLRVNTTLINIVRWLSINITVFSLAWLLCYFNDVRNNKYWFGKQVDNADKYIARITASPAPKEKTWKLEVIVLNAIHGNNATPVTGKAFIYVFKDRETFPFKQGDTILLPGQWQPIKNTGNPFEFDYAGYCAKNNLYYRQFLSANEIVLYDHGSTTDYTMTEKAHNWCMLQLQEYLPDSSTMGLIQAMLLGDEINLDEHLLQAYSETGIVHIIAISGGNVTIFFLVISYLLWWIRNKKYNWIKYLVALPLVWFYVLMAGAPPSAIRAAIMFSILALGFVLEKQHNSLNFLFAAAFLLLCAEPMWLFAVGFQLSFIAVLSLIVFYQPIYNLVAPVNYFAKQLWATVAASLAAEILVAPMVIYYFHLFPLLFIVANVLAYIFMGIVLVLSMSIIAFSLIPAFANLLGSLSIWLVTYFDKIVFRLQDLNPLSFHFLSLKSYELILIYVGIAGIAAFILRKIKPALFIGLSASCIVLISFCKNEWDARRQQRLIVYNIPNANYVELISAQYYNTLYSDTSLSETKNKYILNPAHTEWHAWRQGRIHDPFCHIGNKTVLVLDSITNYPAQAIDYLVICHTTGIYPEQIQKIFSPKYVVLGAGVKGKELKYWEKKCEQLHIHIYAVANEGAFVLE